MKCSVVIGRIKYPVSLPDSGNIVLGIQPVLGNGLEVTAADTLVLHLARRESDLRQFPGDVRSLVLMMPENFSQLEKFSELENLFIHEYDQPELKGMPAGLPVMRLALNRCEPLKNVKYIRQWLRLKELEVMTNSGIRVLGDLSKFPGLECLKLLFCGSLRQFRGIEALSQLQSLILIGCGGMRFLEIPDSCVNLTELSLVACMNAKSLTVRDATRLESLEISLCSTLEHVILHNSANLRKIKISSAWSLKQIEGLMNVQKLTDIEADHSGLLRQIKEMLPEGQSLVKITDKTYRLKSIIMNAWDDAFSSLKNDTESK